VATKSQPADVAVETPDEALEGATSFDDMIEQGEESAALATIDDQPQQLARTYIDEPTFANDEIALPRLRIAQGLTQEVSDGKARPGEVVLLGHDPVESAMLIPLKFNRNRQRQTGSGQNRVVLCQSGDAMIGVGDPGGNCLTCPQAKWRPSVTNPGKNDPPDCRLNYSYICYSVTHGTVVELEIATTNKGRQQAAQYINTLIQHLRLGNFAVEMTVGKEQSPRGTYFVPKMNKVAVDASMLAAARESLGQATE
jgi:hypothetical protein